MVSGPPSPAMWSLPALCFLALVAGAFGYSLAPSLLWPEEYHFNAEEINFKTGIVKPFEIWYSTKQNRSRMDLYGGTVSRYYYGMWYDEDGDERSGRVYMVHPQVSDDEEELPEMHCDMMPTGEDEQEDFLPVMETFTYAGTEEHDNKVVQRWTRSSPYRDVMVKEQTLLVEEVDNEVGIPLHHYIKVLNFADGSLQGSKVINYYNYEDDFPVEALDAMNNTHCSEYKTFNHDFHAAVNYLYPEIEADVDIGFNKFKTHHKRIYKDEEHEIRKAIFKSKWEMIVEHNKKNLGYKLGLNQFADRTKSELSYLNAMRVSDPIREGTHKFPYTEEELKKIAEELPENFDLRMLGVLSPVRNQGNCGSCWAFGMAATLEGALARQNGGRVLDLSEQSLVDCAWPYRSHGCGGTEAIDAVFYYVVDHGVPTVEEYGHYLEEDGICRLANMTKIYTIKGFTAVTPNSPDALRAAVYKFGPVSIGVLVTEKMMMYKSGIFYDVECEEVPAMAMNHAVSLVGYGIRDGDLYWIVKNSWGEGWGESGYILMAANKNNCNPMSVPYYPVL